MAGKSFYSNEIKEFWPFQKVAQKVAIFLGYFFEKKFRLQPKKVAQMAKFRPIWSHWTWLLPDTFKRSEDGQCYQRRDSKISPSLVNLTKSC